MTKPGLSADFIKALKKRIPKKRIFTDSIVLDTYAHNSTIPKVVIFAQTETEIQAILKAAQQSQFPLIFHVLRSCPFQYNTLRDYALIILDSGWKNHKILGQGKVIYMGPAVTFSEANSLLSPYHRQIDDTESNLNSSLHALRIIFTDCYILDTHATHSIARFKISHASLLESINNTAPKDPIEIISHSAMKAEGGLGFIAGASFKTIPIAPFKALVFLFFQNLSAACEAIASLPIQEFAALKLMDTASLEVINNNNFLKIDLSDHPHHAVLLINLQKDSQKKQDMLMAQILALAPTLSGLIQTSEWFSQKEHYEILWNRQKKIATSLETACPEGKKLINNTAILPPHHLASFCKLLTLVFNKHGLEKNYLFAHVKSGQVHFLLELDRDSEQHVAQYDDFMTDVIKLTSYYKGELTGKQAPDNALISKIIALCDPDGILNPYAPYPAQSPSTHKPWKTRIAKWIQACFGRYTT